MTINDLVTFLFRASQAEVGLLLRVSDTSRALRALLRAKEHAAMGESPVNLPPVKFRVLEGHPEGNLAIGPAGAKWPPSGAGANEEEELR